MADFGSFAGSLAYPIFSIIPENAFSYSKKLLNIQNQNQNKGSSGNGLADLLGLGGITKGIGDIGTGTGSGLANIGSGIGNFGTGIGGGVNAFGIGAGYGIGSIGAGIGNAETAVGKGIGSGISIGLPLIAFAGLAYLVMKGAK